MSIRTAPAGVAASLTLRPSILRGLAVAFGALVVFSLVPIAWLEVLGRNDSRVDSDPGYAAIAATGILTTACVGATLAVRRPANAVGWLLIGLGALWAATGLAESYGNYGLLIRHGALPSAVEAASFGQNSWSWIFAFLVLIVVCFPEGRPASRRRRRLAAAAVVTALVTSFLGVTSRELDPPLASYTPGYVFLGGMWQNIGFAGVIGLFATVIGGTADCVLRLRRARGVERRQLVCFAYGALLAPLSIGVCLVAGAATGAGELFVGVSIAFAIIILPLATALAILRYRLYAIDRVVNRTVVYGVVSALLGLAFAGLVVGLTRLFATVQNDPSSLAVALAAIVVTAAFLPVRERVQRSVDRRFARRRFAAVSMVEQFATRLRNDREPPERIGAVLAEALRDPGLVVAFPRMHGQELLDPYGSPAKGPPACATTVVGPADEPTALLLHDAVLDEDPDILGAVTAAARLPLEIARLRVEVRGQLEEMRASRARIVAAQDAERRRVERDIHDGAQQRLVALALSLQVARRRHETGETLDIGTLLDQTSAELGAAVEDLRELARGVYPAVLREDGLAEALRALARRTPLAVTVDAVAPGLAGGVEAAAYFLASEAVTNAVRHAQASKLTILVEHDGSHLRVSVVDDGKGGAAANRGSGLAGLADRFAALGGSMLVVSAPGRGTSVIGELPCES